MYSPVKDYFTAEALDVASRLQGRGGAGARAYSTVHGINILGGAPSVPVNTDKRGFVFFTKPILNLSYDNVRQFRKLAFLANHDPLSAANVIRCSLNPPGYDTYMPGSKVRKEGYGDDSRSVIVDDNSPFIDLLTNSLVSLSGWRDPVYDVYTSKEAFSKSQYSLITSYPDDNSSFPLTATFSGMDGNLVGTLFDVWTEVQARLYSGSMLAFPEHIAEVSICYTTCIYRFIMDSTNRYVQRVASIGGGFPVSTPKAAIFDMKVEEIDSQVNNIMTIPFQCSGAIYDDPAILDDFNLIMVESNPLMADSERENEFRKLRPEEFALYSDKAYPRVAPTKELEWWVPIGHYNEIQKILKEGAS